MNANSYTTKLAEKIDKHCKAEGYSEIGLRLSWDEWQTIISSLTQLPGPSGEPAAWLWIDKEDGVTTFWSFKGDSDSWEYVPLYRSPATPR